MSKSCVVVSIYASTVTVFSIALIVLGIIGREESKSSRDSGPNYYVGSFVVGSAFALVGIATMIFIVAAYNNEDGEKVCLEFAKTCSCCIPYALGFGACIAGFVFVIRFGIQSCDDIDERSDNCSYNINIDTNYTIAVLSLVFIMLLFLSLWCSWSILFVSEKKWKKSNRDSVRRLSVQRRTREATK